MKIISSKIAFSLLELIVASVLVVIVVLGVFAVNSVFTNNNQDYGQKYSVKSETQITLNHILNNASLAVGSGTSDALGNLDLGIQIGTGNVASGGKDIGVGDLNSFCIHQKTNRDIWVCYTWYPSTNSTYPNQIVYCTFAFASAGTNRGAASCTAADSPIYLGRAYNNPAVKFNATSGFSITIQNCLDDSPAGTCNPASPGGSKDPANNPGVTVSGSVFPSQEGMEQTP